MANLTYAALWQLVHDTLQGMKDYVKGDLDLVDKIVGGATDSKPSPHISGLIGLLKDVPKFTEELVILRNKYRGK